MGWVEDQLGEQDLVATPVYLCMWSFRMEFSFKRADDRS